MQRTLVQFMWNVWSQVAIILFIHLSRHMEVGFQDVLLLCCSLLILDAISIPAIAEYGG
jgi:hypothetical protein